MRWDECGILEIDIHVHTVASGHAFGTVSELMTAAVAKGLTILGISDHGPSMVGAPKKGYFTMASDIARWGGPLGLLFGCEANILNLDGELDLDNRTQERLDFVMAGLHSSTPYDAVDNSKENNTRALIAALQLHRPDVLTHPVNRRFPIKIDDIVVTAAELGVALEVNARVLHTVSLQLLDQYHRLLDAAFQEKAFLILGSDAHIPALVGDVTSLMPLRKELLAVADQIVNFDHQHFSAWRAYVASRRKTIMGHT